MRTAIFILIIMSCTFLGAAILFYEDFPTSNFPDGWTRTGPVLSAWNISNTAYAGGTAYELRFSYTTPSATGTYMCISPPIDTRKVHNMNLSFRHALDDISFNDGEIIGVQISTDMTNWTTLWSIPATEDIAPNLQNISINYELGRSETTYIAFFFEGNNYNIMYWFIDDISLTYSHTLGDGTWPAGDYLPVGNIFVPDGYTWQIEAGANISMEPDAYIDVKGRCLVNGTAEQEVMLSSISTSDYWGGIWFENINALNDSSIIAFADISRTNCASIYVENSPKLRISNSEFYNTTYGAVNCNSDIIVEYCDFYNNDASQSPVLRFEYCEPTFRYNKVHENWEYYYVASFSNVILSSIKNNYFGFNDRFPTNDNVATVSLNNCGGVFERNVIVRNYKDGIRITGSIQPITISNCTIAYNTRDGIYTSTPLSIINTIVYINLRNQILNDALSTSLHIDYSCIEDGIGGIAGNGIDPTNYNNNISADPQFVLVSPYMYSSDWTLQDTSPCIDAGDPSYPLNSDGTWEDIGAYYRLLRPFIYMAADVYPDQGRQLDLRWNRNEFDFSYNPAAWYYVFREATSRNDNAIYIASPQHLTPDLISESRDIYWRDGNRTWHLIGDHPALAWQEYALIVPTLQDSSSTGTHELDYMVLFTYESGYWESLTKSAYSVDNIPPYAPARVEIAHLSGSSFNFTWDEVTEGGWEGNSYPEINQITYKIYSGDTPDFEISPETYLLSTTTPEAVLTNQTADRKFFKIIASDSD